jgi:hypothetical protein
MSTVGVFEHLTDDDDLRLWEAAIETIFGDAELLCKANRSKRPIFAQIGRCSHWLSPHNKGSWFKDIEKFAWPTGYGQNGSLIFGLPEFDWSVVWNWNEASAAWDVVPQLLGKRLLLFRVSLPGRTARHVRAVVHTLWTPGSPTIPNEELLQGYAFKKIGSDWKCVAVAGREQAYMRTQLTEDCTKPPKGSEVRQIKRNTDPPNI